ncbi:esterase/lipase family protein [Nocardia alni]|uniref:esterase/lipase family protein n=1 Tax=Nocardia alni TaxID=2815723 RepID=UPI001C220377|nr:hypothetical protein [Nocardia alni]
MVTEWEFPEAGPMPEHSVARATSARVSGISNPITDDAVVVIPGIMGTELVDTATGKLIWGLHPGLLARMWSAPVGGLAPLAFDPERNSVKPARLLRVPAFAPFLAGIEPYTKLVRRLRETVRDPAAVLEFGYDWRLPVRHNAVLLAEAIDAHLARWRAASDRPRARIHLVAHSMGGLLCHSLAAIPGAMENVANVVTLGTPFEGAPKVVLTIASGSGAPVPARGLRAVAATMPGLYDLLPTYRCVDDGDVVRRLTAADIGNIGGRTDLARDAFEHKDTLAAVAIASHRPLIGVAQPTVCSLSIDAGQAEPLYHTFEVDADGALSTRPDSTLLRLPGRGDGTVPRNSAVPHHHRETVPLPQQHGPLAQTDEAIAFVLDRLLHRDTGPRLGEADLGMHSPDLVRPGQEFTIDILGIDSPVDARVTITDVADNEPISRPRLEFREGRIVAPVTVHAPGLYRATVAGSGTSPVTQLFLAPDRVDA